MDIAKTMAEAGKEVVSRRCMIRASMLDASARALAASARALHRPYSPSRKAVLMELLKPLRPDGRLSEVGPSLLQQSACLPCRQPRATQTNHIGCAGARDLPAA